MDPFPSVDGVLLNVDPFFCPIRRVTFSVCPCRVGSKCDFESVAFEVETNGSVKAVAAIKLAAAVLMQQLFHFCDKSLILSRVGVSASDFGDIDPVMFKPVSCFQFLPSTVNFLKALSVTYIGQLVQLTDANLIQLAGTSRKHIKDICKVLLANGLSLGMELNE